MRKPSVPRCRSRRRSCQRYPRKVRVLLSISVGHRGRFERPNDITTGSALGKKMTHGMSEESPRYESAKDIRELSHVSDELGVIDRPSLSNTDKGARRCANAFDGFGTRKFFYVDSGR